MSRIAEAFRKAGASPFPSSLPVSGAASAAEWLTAELPWDLGQSDTSGPAHRAYGGAHNAVVAAPPDRDRIQRPGKRTTAEPPPEELVAVVQYIVHATASERPLRSLVFAGIDRERSADLSAGAAEALAEQLATSAGSVCLVDANLRSPSLHVLFGVNDARGLAGLLRDGGDVQSSVTELTDNLWLLPAGDVPADAMPPLSREHIRRCVASLRTIFDYIVIDAAPLSDSRDALALGREVDGVVLVVDANATRRQVAVRMAEQLRAADVNLLGAILRGRDFPIPDSIYRLL